MEFKVGDSVRIKKRGTYYYCQRDSDPKYSKCSTCPLFNGATYIIDKVHSNNFIAIKGPEPNCIPFDYCSRIKFAFEKIECWKLVERKIK